MKLGFVCTNYNNASYTRSFVESVFAQSVDGIRIVVVDNDSGAEDVAALQDLAANFPALDLVLNSSNVGYFPGLNVGICRLRTRFPDIHHLVVGNNDLVFPETFVETLRRHREILDRWAVVAPDLVTPEGIHQNPHVVEAIGRGRRLVWDIHYSSYGAAALVRRLVRLAGALVARKENARGNLLHESAGPVEQGYGACYVLGPVFFRHFNRFYAPTFLMQEEYFLYEQLRTIGQLTYYDPRFVVQHRGHATMGRLPTRPLWAIARDAHLQYKSFLKLLDAERLERIEVFSKSPYSHDCRPPHPGAPA